MLLIVVWRASPERKELMSPRPCCPVEAVAGAWLDAAGVEGAAGAGAETGAGAMGGATGVLDDDAGRGDGVGLGCRFTSQKRESKICEADRPLTPSQLKSLFP
jgi:hypothetical protein